MRIVYIINSLAHKGGAERIISEKMNYLSALDNYNVSVITCYQFPESMPNTYYLSDKVKQFNLEFNPYRQYKYNYPKRLWVRWRQNCKLRHLLEDKVNTIDPDILIGTGYCLADVVCSIRCRAAKIIEAHEARGFTLRQMPPYQNPIKNLYNWLYRRFYLQYIERKANVIVTLTKEDAIEWKKAKRVEIIPNFSIMPISRLSTCENKKVIAIGRIDWQKGYDRLVDIWGIVSDKHSDWQLDIYGEGALKSEIERKIKDKGLSNITIHSYTHDISSKYADSSICVLTSRYEGFSLVLLEALRHGVPCVTFNCPYGPDSVVDDRLSGYVVTNGDIVQFANRLCDLIENTNLRKKFASEALRRAQKFDVETIMNNWKDLFSSLESIYSIQAVANTTEKILP